MTATLWPDRRRRRNLTRPVDYDAGSHVVTAAGPRVAAIVFYLSCQTMAMVLLPTAGKTPPPWRWRVDTLASSLGQHGVYALTVAAVQNRLDPVDLSESCREMSKAHQSPGDQIQV